MRLKPKTMVLRLLTDADNVCFTVNIQLKRGGVADRISFGWAVWNLFRLSTSVVAYAIALPLSTGYSVKGYF